jgi:regulatory protein
MRISKYKKLKNNIYEVTLENDEKIKLYEDVILKEELLLKKEIDDIERLTDINSKYDIFNVSLKYLNHHVISIKGMKDYLLKKGYLEKDIDETINKLIDKGYLNDSYYAKCYISDHVNLSNDGPYKMIKHLEDNDINSSIYGEFLSKYNDTWNDRIEKYINKNLKVNKKSTYFFKSKMLVNLVNLGYDKEMINECLNKISIDNLDELKEIEKEKIRKKLSRKYNGDELERKIKEKLFQKGFFE